MTAVIFHAIPTADAERYRAGGFDANGQPPERATSDGGGNPCRHCLSEIPGGAGMLILAHRPFPAAQPYAEIGPIFLCAEPCTRAEPDEKTPAMFLDWEKLLMRGYGEDDRIVYGTGQIIETASIAAAASAAFADPQVRYLHLRSASNNCYQARIDRA